MSLGMQYSTRKTRLYVALSLRIDPYAPLVHEAIAVRNVTCHLSRLRSLVPLQAY